MRLDAYKSLWGVVSCDGGRHSLAEALSAAKAAGYVGVECSVRLALLLDSGDVPGHKQGGFSAGLRDHGLSWVPIAFSSGPVWRGWSPFPPDAAYKAVWSDSPARHAAALREQLKVAVSLCCHTPFAVAHSGHDSWKVAQSVEFCGLALEAAQAEGFSLLHETHRGRLTANPWTLAAVAAQLPSLRIVADYSHFTAACEVAMSENDEALEFALGALAGHVDHIHARVGDERRPQLDPRCSFSAVEVAAFENAWRRIWQSQRQRGCTVSTFTPEYGPQPYSPPDCPVEEVEDMNAWQCQRLRQCFEESNFKDV